MTREGSVATHPIIAVAITKRTSAGLVLRFNTPDRDDPFVCYPKDEAQKAAWLRNASAKGWTEA